MLTRSLCDSRAADVLKLLLCCKHQPASRPHSQRQINKLSSWIKCPGAESIWILIFLYNFSFTVIANLASSGILKQKESQRREQVAFAGAEAKWM